MPALHERCVSSHEMLCRDSAIRHFHVAIRTGDVSSGPGIVTRRAYRPSFTFRLRPGFIDGRCSPVEPRRMKAYRSVPIPQGSCAVCFRRAAKERSATNLRSLARSLLNVADRQQHLAGEAGTEPFAICTSSTGSGTVSVRCRTSPISPEPGRWQLEPLRMESKPSCLQSERRAASAWFRPGQRNLVVWQ